MTRSSSDRKATCWPLASEIAAVREEAVRQQRRVTRILLKSAELRIVVVGMAKGVTWPEHTATGESSYAWN
jgi:quercetin dioxygenase-like cupin family protein